MPAARQEANTVGKCSASLGPEMAAIEESATSAGDLAEHGARHDVARAKLGVFVHRAHETLPPPIDEQRAFAAQGLGGERRGILANIDGGRMKLDELGVGDDRAGAGGDGDALATRLARIGGDGVDLARAAGCEHDGACRQQQPARQWPALDRHKLDALHAAVAQQEIAGGEALDHADRWRGAHSREQRRHDGAPRGVALDMQDAVAAMRGLAPKHEMTRKILVEGHAVAKQVLDPVARFARQQLGNLLIDNAGAGADRIFGMMLGAVALGQRRGDAGLRPETGCAFAEPRAGNDGDRQRRKLERGEQAGKARTHHDHAARPALHSRWELAV